MKQISLNKLLFVSILILVGNIIPMMASADSYYQPGPPASIGTLNIGGAHSGTLSDPFQIGDIITASGTAYCNAPNCFQSAINATIRRADHDWEKANPWVDFYKDLYTDVNNISGYNKNTVPVGQYSKNYFNLHGETSFTVPFIPGDYEMYFGVFNMASYRSVQDSHFSIPFTVAAAPVASVTPSCTAGCTGNYNSTITTPGACTGTVAGSVGSDGSPDGPYEGESCEPFSQGACGTSWLTHGCRWIPTKTTTTANSCSSLSSSSSCSSQSSCTWNSCDVITPKVTVFVNDSKNPDPVDAKSSVRVYWDSIGATSCQCTYSDATGKKLGDCGTGVGLHVRSTPTSFVVDKKTIFDVTCNDEDVNTATNVSSIRTPPSIVEIVNTGTVGGTRIQAFRIGDSVMPGDVFSIQVYSHIISTTAVVGDKPLNIMVKLRNAVDATTAVQWNDHQSAPRPGTPGFKPTTSRRSDNELGLVLNYQNQFGANVIPAK